MGVKQWHQAREQIDWPKALADKRAIIPNLDSLPDHVRVGRLFSGVAGCRGLPDVLADLVPEQREFWLRVGAEVEIMFLEGMTAMFEFEPESPARTQRREHRGNGTRANLQADR